MATERNKLQIRFQAATKRVDVTLTVMMLKSMSTYVLN